MEKVPAPALAAIFCPTGAVIDELLIDVAGQLRTEGAVVCGHVQRNFPDPVQGTSTLRVEDIATRLTVSIGQELGAWSRGCRLDPAALADVAGGLLQLLDGPVDLLILHRFGKDEAEGRGLRAVIEKACGAGVPVLTVVRPAHAGAWSDFAGGLATTLPAEAGPVLDWARQASRAVRMGRSAA